MTFKKRWAAAAVIMALAGSAQSALVGLGDGTVKDTNTNLIWLQDWNVNGLGNWTTQKNWAENLDFAGSSDWVLPSIDQVSALKRSYGNLGGVSAFTNVQTTDPFFYWSGDEGPSGTAVGFLPSGTTGGSPKSLQYFAVAVRVGDATVPVSVPEPQTLALVLLAWGAAAVARRRRPA